MEQCQAKCQNPAKPTKAPEVYTQSAERSDVVQPTILTEELTVSEPQVQLNDSKQEITELEPKDGCFSPMDRGTCDGAEKRFAYNPKTRRCQVFQYSGCGGNGNNFTSRKHCYRKCIRSKSAHGMKMIRIRKKNLDNIVLRGV
ncbi:hypothetical protein INR49_026824 [Caranx melampygus]|nr:hypothetical protein INR49_026824 [Caranx melampygus]